MQMSAQVTAAAGVKRIRWVSPKEPSTLNGKPDPSHQAEMVVEMCGHRENKNKNENENDKNEATGQGSREPGQSRHESQEPGTIAGSRLDGGCLTKKGVRGPIRP